MNVEGQCDLCPLFLPPADPKSMGNVKSMQEWNESINVTSSDLCPVTYNVIKRKVYKYIK